MKTTFTFLALYCLLSTFIFAQSKPLGYPNVSIASVGSSAFASHLKEVVGKRSSPLFKTANSKTSGAMMPCPLFSNEVHIDDSGADANERIEIAGDVGTSLTGWSVVFYTGDNGTVYGTANLSGTISATNSCVVGGRTLGFVVVNVVASIGTSFQNGPDGWALVNGSTVVEFFSYEGTFTATAGVANGLTSTDIGTSESGTGADTGSIQRTGAATWLTNTSTNTFGACNTTQYSPACSSIPSVNLSVSAMEGAEANTTMITATVSATAAVSGAQTVSLAVSGTGITVGDYSLSNTTVTIPNGMTVGTVTFTVVNDMLIEGLETATLTISNPSAGITLGANTARNIAIYDNDIAAATACLLFSNEIHYKNNGVDNNERIEIAGDVGTSLSGWSIVLYDGSTGQTYGTANLSGVIPNTNTCVVGTRTLGTVVMNAVADASTGIQNDIDGWALVYNSAVVEFLSYDGTFMATNGPALGQTSTNIGTTEVEASTNPNGSIQRTGASTWVASVNSNTFGQCNTTQYASCACPTFAGSPGPAIITNSTCSSCTLSGGSISAPSGTCPTGSTLQYKLGNGAWSSTIPVYDQDGPAQTIKTRCSCDNDPSMRSDSSSVTTIPGTCTSPTPTIGVVESSGTTANDGITCSGANVTLSTSGGGTYLWSPGGAMTSSIMVAPTITTTYTVTVTASNGCTGTDTQIITVNPNPMPTIGVLESSGTTANDGITCSGANVTLSTSGGGTYLWSPGGATSSSIMVAPTITTTYTVTVTNNGCTGTATQIITVNPNPIVNIEQLDELNAAHTGPICAGESLNLRANGGASSNLWNTNENTQTINVAPTITTNYSVTITNGFGCSGSGSTTVMVDQPATVDAGMDGSACSESPIVALLGSFGGTATAATWTGGTGTFDPDANTPNALYTLSPAEVLAGTVTLTLTTDDPPGVCLAVSDEVTFTVEEPGIVFLETEGPGTANCGDIIDINFNVNTQGASITSAQFSVNWDETLLEYVSHTPVGFGSPVVGTTNVANGELEFSWLSSTLGGDALQTSLLTVSFKVKASTGTTNVEITNTPIVVEVANGNLCLVPVTIDNSDTQIGLEPIEVTCPANTSVCISDAAFQLGGATPSGGVYSGAGVSGNGPYIFTPASAGAGIHTITYTYTDADCSNTCTYTITVDAVAMANAGDDQGVCVSSPTVTLAGTVGGAVSTGTWSGGTGTFDPDANTLNVTYTLSPAEIIAATVTLTLTSADPIGPCPAVMDQVTITVEESATADAGMDVTICASDTVELNGSVGGAATSGTWSTSGTGTFLPNATTLNAKYLPSAADTAANTVTLTLTTNDPVGDCGPAVDMMVVTIDPASIVNAGPDQTICATDTIYLSATLSGVANALVWQKNAAFGDFVGSDTSPSAKYVLNATGQQLSSIKFGVMSSDPGDNVCKGGLDTVQIFINPAAYVNAGVDTTICASTTSIKLKGSISGAATSATWTTSGTGSFSPNATTLNATYTPSLADTAAGTVTLTLTTNDPAGALCGPAVDTRVITIDPASIVNAGPDQTICATDTIYLSATLSGVADALVWQKNAAFGDFIGSDTSPSAKYVLNATGQQLSSIKFGVMSSDPGDNVCQGGLDTVQIFISPAAYVNAGIDTTICASTISVKLNGSISGEATMATWTTSGTGTFSPNATTLNATYTPSLADTAAGTVTLTLTTNDPAGALCGPAVDTRVITIDPASIVNAGPDQTICATDTIYLSATLSGVADALVWQKNAAFGDFIGSDTSPSAKYVLNATGQQLSSIKFGVMSSDPGDNVCKGGLDTVEIFISHPINASVSIDLDTVCVGGAFTMTFNESTLPQGSEFTLVVKYTDENGAGSKTLSNVSDGDQTIFEEGIDFDGILTVTQIIVTPETAGFCADTLDGFKVEVVVCEATIVDPCVCQNNAQIGQNGTNSNTGTFKDVVRIEGPINQTWTVASVSGLYEDAAGTDPVDVSDAFIQVSPGVYELVGYHIDAIGYTISVSNGRGVTLEANNKCFYPNPVFTGLPALVAPSAAPFQVTGTVADNVAGTGTFILDGVPQAGASPAPTVVTINPGTLSPGPHTLIYSFDAGVAASKDSLDPGCIQVVRQRFQVANCGCQDVTVSLDANCQFLLTGNLVSDVNCGGGTVRVMDNDPSNGGLIDCAGVWTYGLFDAFGNIICWGKVTAEDKTAPVLVCAPADFTLDCYDVNYVLNNRLTIGNVGATSSPRPAATSSQTINNAEGVAGTGDNCQLGLAPPSLVSDNIKNLGYAYFKDNCYNCGCRVALKWSDKVEFYSCEQMKINGGYYAVISREWTATDCNGMRSSYVQKIKFTRPAVDDFVFNGPGEGKYDRVVEYNSCTPDKSLIKKEDVTPYVCSYFNTSANPRCLFIDQVECNYSVSIKDTEFPICGGKGVKIDRELYVLDWCAGGIVDTFHILIKIGDFQAPTVEYAHGAPFDISTGPMDCTAAIPVSVAGIKTAFGVTIKDNCNLGNISVSVYTKDRYVKGILVYEGPEDPICIEANRKQVGELRGDHEDYRLGDCTKEDDICWDKVEYSVMNGMMIGLPVGKHLMVIEAFDGCYNASTTCFVFEVKDKIAPIMKCDDDLHVTLSNANGYTNGYAQVSADDIDEGSWDNCKMAWIAVRRNVPDGCAASFIQKGYDTNGNGKLDALPADGDVSKADGFDRNGDGDIADFGETFILKGGKLMTPLLDFVEFFCCDLTERVTVELWGGDIYGNTNYCWMDLLIEDKVAPTCLAPWDVTVYCDDKNLASIDSKAGSAAAFGDILIPSGNDCAALDTVYTTEKKLKCGAGYIDRIWTLTKQTVKGPITITCTQRIWVNPVHEYNICFPKDVSTDCKTPIIDTVLTDELGCDILAVNVHDKRYDASDDECYKIFRTYSVINWCTYDDRCGDPLEQTNISIIPRDVFGNYGKAPIYVLVRDREDNRRDGVEEFYISKDLIPGNADDIRFKPEYCEVADEFYHSFIYTQIIKVYDDTRPVVTGIRDTFCTSPTACTANITKVVTLKDNCTDKVELETQFLMIAPFQTLEAGQMILYSTPRWSTKDLGNGQFEIKVSNLPEGTHDLIVVGRDECGNLSLPTRIPFVVKDCKAPAPICINGLSVDLMPDGNGGGMMTVWASDFVASKIYDCNGQGPETKDGLKLITKYSVNRVQQPVDPNQTSISVNCADLELGFILVELHAWDNAGNHDFCVTYIEVQDNRKVCPAPADKVKIAGTIATEGAGNLQGVSVTLSGSGTQSDMTGTDGNYEFVNITKGGDFTVTPQLDKNHLNGVSTFDLVLIQKHILGVQALNSPYKMIAADANNSKSISTLDMIQIRKLILNIDTHFANNTSWRFVDATYRFPNATNPWSTSFPEVVSVNDLLTNVRANFVAIKVGDVNASASVNGATSAEIRNNANFKLKTLEQNLKTGNEYRVAFTAEDLQNIQGYQFALNLDQNKVELVDIEYGVAKAENFGVFKNEGLITTSWNSKYEPGVLFTLVLRAKADAKLSSTLNLNRVVSPEAYDQHNKNLGIALNFEGIQASEAYELKQNTPNPFSAETVIGFSLPKTMKGTLTVRDVKGAMIYKVEGNYAKGNNQVTLKKEHLGASGVLYYTLETNEFTATKKMIILE